MLFKKVANMWSVLRQSLIRGSESSYAIIKETKRYAGHSKWANIKHAKALKDGQRAILFSKLIRQMNVAISEEGSYKPTENLRLSQVIEQAKKKNMPASTINGVLEKAAKATAKSQVATMDVRGPGGSIIVIVLHTDNFKTLKMLLHGVFKKFKVSAIDQSARHVFHHKGIIVTELMNGLDEATEDAITVGAEDVEEIEEDGEKLLQFTCEANVLPKVANQLSGRKYKIVLREEQFIPHIFANLSEADIERAEALYTKLHTFDEVVAIHDNIA